MALPAAPAPLRPLLRNRTFQQRTPLSGAPVPSIVFVLSSVLPHVAASCLVFAALWLSPHRVHSVCPRREERVQ